MSNQSVIDMMRSMDTDDSSEDSGNEDNDKQKQEDIDIKIVNYKQYLSKTTTSVHKRLHALTTYKKKQEESISQYFKTCHQNEMKFIDDSVVKYNDLYNWIDGKSSLTVGEQMKFVGDRWNAPNAAAKFKGVPCFWGRIIKRIPFFTPMQCEYNAIGNIHKIEVIKKQLEMSEKGFKHTYQVSFEYNENEYISEGAVVQVSYVVCHSYPLNEIINMNVSVIKNNVWKKEIEYGEKKDDCFYNVFDTHLIDQQFVFFYTLIHDCIPNPMRWFDDSIVQKKNMKDLIYEHMKDYDYSNEGNNVLMTDNSSLPCVQQ